MATQISGDTGISQCQPGSVSQADLAANVVGYGPAFRSKITTPQATTTNVWAIVTNWVDINDTANAMGSTQFIAPVAGYYQFNLSLDITGVSITTAGAAIYVNGQQGDVTYLACSLGNQAVVSTSSLTYLAAGEYVDARGFINCSSGPAFGTVSKFSGFLARAA